MRPQAHVARGWILALALGLCPLPVASAEPAQRSFTLPAQSLERSLRELARQCQVDILFATGDVRNITAPALSGSFTPEQAVEALLAGTNLRAAFTSSGSISVRPVAAAEPAPPGPRARPDLPRTTVAPEEIVVTSRAGTETRRKVEASYAITTLSEEQLRMRGPTSVPDALKSVPGFWVEASGGEASANIRARGIPLEGYSTVALYENGLPVQHDSGMSYLNADQSFRLDETIERLEVVRGGPSSIFAAYAPGGTINFIPRRASDHVESLAKFTISDYGQRRVDGWLGGPVGDWRVSAGGFFREDHGVRDPGFRADHGGQFRATVAREFERGRVELDVKRLDDVVDFYLGVPVRLDEHGDAKSIPGFNPNYGTLAGPDTKNRVFRTRTGPYDFDLTEGTHVALTQATLKLDYSFDDWRLENGARYRDSNTVRNGLFPVTPMISRDRVASFLPAAKALFPTVDHVVLRYADTAQPYNGGIQNGNGLVIDAMLRAVVVPEHEFVDDLRLLRKLSLAGDHDIAMGVYFANVEERFQRVSASGLLEVRPQARMLDAVAVDAAGRVLGAMTENGITRYGSEYANSRTGSNTIAAYVSDEWKIAPRLRLDMGVRFEHVAMHGSAERTATINLRQSPTAADDTAISGTGIFDPLDRNFDHTSWTLGTSWQLTPDTALFARYTGTSRLPSLNDFLTNPSRTDMRKQTIHLAEAGWNLSSSMVSLYATGFYTAYDSFTFGELVFNPATNGYDSHSNYADTRSYGVELEGTVRPLSWLEVNFALTWQRSAFRSFRFIESVNGVPTQRDYTGNRLIRAPASSARITPGVNLFDGRVRAEVDVEHYGKRFADAANTQTLPAYTVFGAKLRLDVSDAISVYVYGENLFNEIGLTEGNPRTGQISSNDAGAQVFIARPIVGRNFRLAAMYKF
ncbi:TonB-dependent receptor domain-containing protein [Roseiterribacter gracilis]|uniref:TonB-dependent receptor n=1 Tax=Roseiterribacter gracilis TaxID=2812848 RepID=A0A8S8XAV9_9PROT|nr:TonB-dependent receptor [Rhodospirillales bacterium TMPK1]